MKKVICFLLGYHAEHGKFFPNTSWSTTNLCNGYYIRDPRDLFYDWVDAYPDFFIWVSVLANRRVNLRGIYHSVCRIIRAKGEKDLRIVSKWRDGIQEEIKSLEKFVQENERCLLDYELYSIEVELY
jgi:hypothetical protein